MGSVLEGFKIQGRTGCKVQGFRVWGLRFRVCLLQVQGWRGGGMQCGRFIKQIEPQSPGNVDAASLLSPK